MLIFAPVISSMASVLGFPTGGVYRGAPWSYASLGCDFSRVPGWPHLPGLGSLLSYLMPSLCKKQKVECSFVKCALLKSGVRLHIKPIT